MRPSTYVQVACQQGSLTGRIFAFVDPAPMPLPEPLLLGRGPDCHICFQGENEAMVSRRHGKLWMGRHGVRYADGSSHGTYLLPRQQRCAALPMVAGAPTVLQLGAGGPICQIDVGSAFPFGNYSLVAKLGAGGMAEVYIAADRRLDRFVVLKLLRPERLRSDPQAGQHLLDEARIVAQLEHPQVIRIYELGELGGVPYIAMEYLRGFSLAQLSSQLAVLGQRLPPTLAAAIVRQALLGLHAAHELPTQVVHRDISHNNILITRDAIKVIDFGIARANYRGRKVITGPHITKGCPPYMSPEQISAPQTVTRRSDIFSSAVVLYELCAGHSLFLRDSPVATMAAVLTEEAAPLRSVCAGASARLEQLLHGALNKRQNERRPHTAAAFAAQLKEEISPEFLHHDNIISALEQLGLGMHSAPPLPLLEEPELIQRARSVTSLPKVETPTFVIVAKELGAPLSAPSVCPLQAVALPANDDHFERSTAGFAALHFTHHAVHPHEHRDPIPLALNLDDLVPDCRQPLVLVLANRLAELRVAPATVKAGRSFRIYPVELSTTGARNSYTLPLPCAGKQLQVGHHRGLYHDLTVASSVAEAPGQVPPLELPELGVKLVAPLGTSRLFVVYRCESEYSRGYLVCFTVRSS